MRRRISRIAVVTLAVLALVAPAATAAAAPVDNPLGLPDFGRLVPPASDSQGISASLTIFVLLTVLALAPAVLVMATSFTRTVIVLSLLRQAVGTQQLPPGQVIVGLSLILTMIVMAPTWRVIHRDALEPYLAGQLGQRAAFDRAADPLRKFMIRQIEHSGNEEHVFLFLEYSRGRAIAPDEMVRWGDVSLAELIPAFVLSELKVAFLMGFRIYLPFLVIDMVVAAILISMGMMMLPPVLISLPFKLMLFVLADGWRLVIGSLMASFA